MERLGEWAWQAVCSHMSRADRPAFASTCSAWRALARFVHPPSAYVRSIGDGDHETAARLWAFSSAHIARDVCLYLPSHTMLSAEFEPSRVSEDIGGAGGGGGDGLGWTAARADDVDSSHRQQRTIAWIQRRMLEEGSDDGGSGDEDDDDDDGGGDHEQKCLANLVEELVRCGESFDPVAVHQATVARLCLLLLSAACRNKELLGHPLTRSSRQRWVHRLERLLQLDCIDPAMCRQAPLAVMAAFGRTACVQRLLADARVDPRGGDYAYHSNGFEQWQAAPLGTYMPRRSRSEWSSTERHQPYVWRENDMEYKEDSCVDLVHECSDNEADDHDDDDDDERNYGQNSPPLVLAARDEQDQCISSTVGADDIATFDERLFGTAVPSAESNDHIDRRAPRIESDTDSDVDSALLDDTRRRRRTAYRADSASDSALSDEPPGTAYRVRDHWRGFPLSHYGDDDDGDDNDKDTGIDDCIARQLQQFSSGSRGGSCTEALRLACRGGHLECVRVLLADPRVSDVDVISTAHSTPPTPASPQPFERLEDAAGTPTIVECEVPATRDLHGGEAGGSQNKLPVASRTAWTDGPAAACGRQALYESVLGGHIDIVDCLLQYRPMCTRTAVAFVHFVIDLMHKNRQRCMDNVFGSSYMYHNNNKNNTQRMQSRQREWLGGGGGRGGAGDRAAGDVSASTARAILHLLDATETSLETATTGTTDRLLWLACASGYYPLLARLMRVLPAAARSALSAVMLLEQACLIGAVDVLAALLADERFAIVRPRDRQHLLNVVCAMGHVDALDTLLRDGRFAVRARRNMAYQAAAQHGHVAVLARLLAQHSGGGALTRC